MSNRLTTQQIIDAVNASDRDDVPETWEEVFEAIHHLKESDGAAVLTAAATYLERRFPGRTWGWQDFDKLLTEHIFLRRPDSVRHQTFEYERFGNGMAIVIQGVATIDDVTR